MFKFSLTMLLIGAALAGVWGAVPATQAQDRFALANQLARRGLVADAVKEYAALRDANLPKDEYLFRYAEAVRRTGDAEAAVKLYDELLSAAPASSFADYARLNRALLVPVAERAAVLCTLDRDNVPPAVRQAALFHLGEAAEAAGDTAGAVRYYARAGTCEKGNALAPLARLRAATLQASSSDPAERRKALSAYLDLAASPDPVIAEEAIFYSGYLVYREKRYGEASALFRRLLARWPDSARAGEAKSYAAWSMFLSGNYAEALAVAEPLRNGPRAEEAHYLAAASLRQLERRTEAVAAYTAALKAFPFGKYADSEWMERLAIRAAEADSKGVLEDLAARPDPPAAQRARVFTYGYEAALALDKTDLALQYARRVATGNDAVLAPRALYTTGLLSARAGKHDEAVRAWNELLSRYPSSPFSADALRARGMEEIRLKEYRAAVRTLGEMARRFPERAKDAEFLYWRGVAARGAEDYPEAEKLQRSALDAQPSAEFDREIRLELAYLLRRRGADAEAAVLYTQLLATKAADRLAPAQLAWAAETLLAVSNNASALVAAETLARRNVDASWNQIAAALAGDAHAALGERDAALAAYRRALACDAKTDRGAHAALALGRAEMADGRNDTAKAILSDLVERCRAPSLLSLRTAAYAALAANEEARGDLSAALGYHLMVGTLFDDPELSPKALGRAEEILRKQGKTKEADDLAAERRTRYGSKPRP